MTTQMATISAMDLRKEPGTVLDRVDYRNERIVVERAGKPKAVLVPLRDYEQMERRTREAKARFWEKTQELQAAFKGTDPREIEQAIEAAISDLRASKRTTP